MADTIFDPGPTPPPPPQAQPATIDLDSTADIHEESTSDLDEGVDARASAARDVEDWQVAGDEQDAPAQDSDEIAPAERRDGALGPGMILHNRFLLERVLGTGGVSIVYRARDIHSSGGDSGAGRLALKTPRAQTHDATRAAQRLTHEFEHTQRLSHPNIVRVTELHTTPQPCFMTMELIEGKLLSTHLRERRPLAPALAQKVLQQCGEALAHAHERQVIHGDFKPSNVFLTNDEQIKVIDFGAAASAGDSSRIHAGTPTYASPEVLSGETPEARDDVFSFACVAYEVLTGRHPFDRASSLQARAEGRTPARAWSLTASQWLTLLAALSWDREQRPTDIGAFAKSLLTTDAIEPGMRGIASSEASSDLGVGLGSEDFMPKERNWGFYAFVLCALGVIYFATRTSQEEQAPVEPIQQALATEPAPSQPFQPPMAPPELLGAPVRTDTSGASLNVNTPPTSAEEPAMPAAKDESDRKNGAAEENEKTGALRAQPTRKDKLAAQRPAAVRRSQISFDTDTLITSEGSVALVVLIKRSQPLSGRARVRWRAVSGSADAGIDFASNAAGSVEFADGQAQRAIYVPLRNDLLPEENESFTVILESPQNATLNKVARITATIRDDDDALLAAEQ